MFREFAGALSILSAGLCVAVAAASGIDLGDITVGGNGYGTGVAGQGLSIVTGQFVAPNVFGGSNSGAPGFIRTDGTNGTANLPYVNGVFRPVGATPIDSLGTNFAFPMTNGGRWDAIRNHAAHYEPDLIPPQLIPIQLDDQPGVDRAGVGLHANQGITYDLAALRANGYTFNAVTGVAGLNYNSYPAAPSSVDVWVLVDGVQRYHNAFLANGLHHEAFSIPLSGNERFLSFASTDHDLTLYGDHGVIADAQLVPEPASLLVLALGTLALRRRGC